MNNTVNKTDEYGVFLRGELVKTFGSQTSAEDWAGTTYGLENDDVTIEQLNSADKDE